MYIYCTYMQQVFSTAPAPAAAVSDLAGLGRLSNLRRSWALTRPGKSRSDLVEVEPLGLTHEHEGETTLTAEPIDRGDGDAELNSQVLLAEEGLRRRGRCPSKPLGNTVRKCVQKNVEDVGQLGAKAIGERHLP